MASGGGIKEYCTRSGRKARTIVRERVWLWLLAAGLASRDRPGAGRAPTREIPKGPSAGGADKETAPWRSPLARNPAASGVVARGQDRVRAPRTLSAGRSR